MWCQESHAKVQGIFKRSLTPSTVTYASAVGAAEKARDYEQFLQLLGEMQATGLNRSNTQGDRWYLQ